MANRAGMWIVLLILVAGGSAGALASYRMHVQQSWVDEGPPLDVRVTIDWPDGRGVAYNLTVQGTNTTVLGSLLVAAATYNHTVRGAHFDDLNGYFVECIDDWCPEKKTSCGWMWGINGLDRAHRGTTAADTAWLNAGDWVAWYWDCA